MPVETQLLLYDVLTGMCGVAGMPGIFFRFTRKHDPLWGRGLEQDGPYEPRNPRNPAR